LTEDLATFATDDYPMTSHAAQNMEGVHEPTEQPPSLMKVPRKTTPHIRLFATDESRQTDDPSK
jgi:hypothetical protein